MQTNVECVQNTHPCAVIRQKQELKMKIINADPVLECNLEEFGNKYWSPSWASMEHEVEKALRGESAVRPPYRIPSADKMGAVYFYSREMLCRFAGLSTNIQMLFLRTVRKALAENQVKQVVITIPWSKSNNRRLRIRSSVVGDNSLDFEVML